MKTRFVFDVEAQDLQREGFAYGYVVVRISESNELTILEKGECYSILGAKGACDFVQKNVIPSLSVLTPYINSAYSVSSTLPNEIVQTTKELRDRFFETYMKWKKEGAEIWSDVNFPVETNFLSAVVKDGEGSRDWDMPYPLRDVAAFVDISIKRNEYSGLLGLREHNPLDDSLASAYSLYRYEVALARKNKSLLSVLQNSGSPIHKPTGLEVTISSQEDIKEANPAVLKHY